MRDLFDKVFIAWMSFLLVLIAIFAIDSLVHFRFGQAATLLCALTWGLVLLSLMELRDNLP